MRGEDVLALPPFSLRIWPSCMREDNGLAMVGAIVNRRGSLGPDVWRAQLVRTGMSEGCRPVLLNTGEDMSSPLPPWCFGLLPCRVRCLRNLPAPVRNGAPVFSPTPA